MENNPKLQGILDEDAGLPPQSNDPQYLEGYMFEAACTDASENPPRFPSNKYYMETYLHLKAQMELEEDLGEDL